MKILVTNDDGIFSEGIWALVRELDRVARVIVVAPDSEQSAIGTAVSLRRPLRILRVDPRVPGVETYSVDGTPSDSVILALGKLVRDGVDMVISGVNHGSNLGEDILISGTVGGALQGYLRGFSSMAVSAPSGDSRQLEAAARAAALLASGVDTFSPPVRVFLNVNVPELGPGGIAGVRTTRMARQSHVNTVEEGNHGAEKYYRLVRQRVDSAIEDGTDADAVERGYISLTPLYFSQADRPPAALLDMLRANLARQMRHYGSVP